MPTLAVLRGSQLELYEVPTDRALRLGPCGTPAVPDENAIVSFVTYELAGSGRRACAVVPWPAGRVRAGADRLIAPREVTQGEHLFFGDVEVIFRADVAPLAIAAAEGASCPVCCEPALRPESCGLLACAICGSRACALCWRSFEAGRCPAPGCGHVALPDGGPTAPPRSAFVTAWLDEPGSDPR
jgi:hypothetical protein